MKLMKKTWSPPKIQSELSIERTLAKDQVGPDGGACLSETAGSCI